MKIIKNHSLILSLIIVLLCAAISAVVGFFYARYVVTDLAEAVRSKHPDDPLSGIAFIGFGILIESIITGTVIGLIAGTLSYFFVGRTKKLV